MREYGFEKPRSYFNQGFQLGIIFGGLGALIMLGRDKSIIELLETRSPRLIKGAGINNSIESLKDEGRKVIEETHEEFVSSLEAASLNNPTPTLVTNAGNKLLDTASEMISHHAADVKPEEIGSSTSFDENSEKPSPTINRGDTPLA